MKILVFLFPIILFLSFLSIKLLLPDVYTTLIQEDSSIEYLQALIYFVSSILTFYVLVKFFRNRMILHGILYGILAIGLFFISIEEISWGQRIFNSSTPVYFEHRNIQKEISIHNLDVIQPLLHKVYIIVGAYGAFAWVFLVVILPRSKSSSRHILNYLVPDWFISPYFFFTFFIYTLFEYISYPYPGGFLVWRDQEPMELLLSIGFFSFVATNCIRLRYCLTRRST